MPGIGILKINCAAYHGIEQISSFLSPFLLLSTCHGSLSPFSSPGEMTGSGCVRSLHLARERPHRVVPFASPFLPFENVHARAETAVRPKKNGAISANMFEKIMTRRYFPFFREVFVEFLDKEFVTFKFLPSESISDSVTCYEKNRNFIINTKPTLDSAMNNVFLAYSTALTSTRQKRSIIFYIKYSRVSTIKFCQSKKYLEA